MRKNPQLIDRQITAKGCAPIAITNALTWGGFFGNSNAVSQYPAIEAIVGKMGHSTSRGSRSDTIHHAVAAAGFRFEYFQVRSVREIEVGLDHYSAMLLVYVWKQELMRPVRQKGAHLVFVDGHEGNFLNIYNVNGNGAEYKPMLDSYLKKFGGEMWCLKKPRTPKSLKKLKETAKIVEIMRSDVKELLDRYKETVEDTEKENL